MAAAEYLPPLVTKLTGDISDLLGAFEQSKLAAKAWAAEMKRELTADMRITGHTTGEAFRKETTREVDKLADDLERTAGRSFTKAGARTAASFGEGFSSVAAAPGPYGMAAIVTLALGAAVLLAPAIGAAIGGALTLGLGVGFLGLGFFLVKDRPKIIKAMHGLGDDISKIFKTAAAPLQAPFLSAIRIIDREFKKLAPTFRHIFANVAPLIQPFVKGLTGALDKMMPGISEAISNMGPAFKALGEALPGIGLALGNFFADISENGPALARFITDSGTGLSKLITALGKTIAWLEGAYLWMSNFAINLKTKWLPSAGSAIKGWYDAVVAWFGRAVDWVKALPGKIGAALAALPGVLGSLANRAFHAFSYAAGYAVGKVIKFFADLPANIPIWLARLWETLTTWGAKLIIAGTAWAKQLWPRAKVGAESLVTKIKEFLAGAPGWLEKTGKDMLIGLWNGFKSKLDWIVGKVKSGFGSIIQGARDALESHSPSKVFERLGGDSADGYVNGWLKNTGRVWGALASVLGAGSVGRPGVGGPNLSPDIVAASSGGGGGAPAPMAYGVAHLYLDGKKFATAMIAPVQQINGRNNRPVYGSVG